MAMRERGRPAARSPLNLARTMSHGARGVAHEQRDLDAVPHRAETPVRDAAEAAARAETPVRDAAEAAAGRPRRTHSASVGVPLTLFLCHQMPPDDGRAGGGVV